MRSVVRFILCVSFLFRCVLLVCFLDVPLRADANTNPRFACCRVSLPFCCALLVCCLAVSLRADANTNSRFAFVLRFRSVLLLVACAFACLLAGLLASLLGFFSCLLVCVLTCVKRFCNIPKVWLCSRGLAQDMFLVHALPRSKPWSYIAL